MSAQKPANPFSRPIFPTLQPSASSQPSAFQSYSSSTSLSSQSSVSSAPLPSPSLTQSQRQDFVDSLNAQEEPQQQQSQAAAQQQSAQRQSSYDYSQNRASAGSTAAETNTYLDQFALLAEAAKRAQMAVVMRDIEGMEL